MTTRSITRASFLAAMLGAGVLAIAPDAHAARNADAAAHTSSASVTAVTTAA